MAMPRSVGVSLDMLVVGGLVGRVGPENMKS